MNIYILKTLLDYAIEGSFTFDLKYLTDLVGEIEALEDEVVKLKADNSTSYDIARQLLSSVEYYSAPQSLGADGELHRTLSVKLNPLVVSDDTLAKFVQIVNPHGRTVRDPMHPED